MQGFRNYAMENQQYTKPSTPPPSPPMKGKHTLHKKFIIFLFCDGTQSTAFLFVQT